MRKTRKGKEQLRVVSAEVLKRRMSNRLAKLWNPVDA
jgi:hypothetical protein